MFPYNSVSEVLIYFNALDFTRTLELDQTVSCVAVSDLRFVTTSLILFGFVCCYLYFNIDWALWRANPWTPGSCHDTALSAWTAFAICCSTHVFVKLYDHFTFYVGLNMFIGDHSGILTSQGLILRSHVPVPHVLILNKTSLVVFALRTYAIHKCLLYTLTKHALNSSGSHISMYTY